MILIPFQINNLTSQSMPRPLILEKLKSNSLWPTRPSRTNRKKRYRFHHEGRDAKVGSQEITGITGNFGLGVQNVAGQRLITFCQENALVIANTLFQQHKRRLYTWTSPNGQYQDQIDYFLCNRRWRSSTESAKQDLKLTMAQIMSSLLHN